MKSTIRSSNQGGPSDAATRVSQARLRIDTSNRAEPSPTTPTEATPDMVVDLLRRLTGEIADVMMTIQPAVTTLDELAQNEALLVEPAQVLNQASLRLGRYVKDVNLLIGQPFDEGPAAPLQILEDFIEQRIVGESPHARFVSRLALDLWDVEIGPSDLRTICRQLTDNAFTATARGGSVRLEADNVRLRVGSGAKLPEGDYVRIRVSDEGIGMSETTLARATDPFFTTWGHMAHWRGLGLAQVATICRRGRGALELYSAEGRGTVVTILLRRALGNRPLLDGGRVRRAASAVPVPSQFLIVDDEPLVLASLRRVLTQRGHLVHLAQDAHTALAIVREGAPCQFAIVDLHLGQASGLELAWDIAALRPELRLVLTAGLRSVEASTKDSAPPGCAGRLAKPYDVDELLSLLACDRTFSSGG